VLVLSLPLMPKADIGSVSAALLWLSDIARRAAMCCAGPTITPARRSMSAALELGGRA